MISAFRSATVLAGALLLGVCTAAGAQTGAAAADKPALDPVLVSQAASMYYKKELARINLTHNLNEEKWQFALVRRSGERLLPRVKAAYPATAAWSWALSLETRPEMIAWALPNGQIMVSTGLVQGLALTDAELAAILAHAIAHAVSGQDLRDAASAYRRIRTDVDPDTNRAAVELSEILGKLMVTPHYDAADEKAVDAIAIELLARSAVNPTAAVSAWRKVARSGSSTPPGLLALHPVTAVRMADLEAQAEAVKPLYEEARAAGAVPAKSPPQDMKSKSSVPKNYQPPPPRQKSPSSKKPPSTDP
jgi:predicted Zn-dependent protease